MITATNYLLLWGALLSKTLVFIYLFIYFLLVYLFIYLFIYLFTFLFIYLLYFLFFIYLFIFFGRGGFNHFQALNTLQNFNLHLLELNVFEGFCLQIKKSIIHGKETLLLSDLLEYIKCLREEHSLEESLITIIIIL